MGGRSLSNSSPLTSGPQRIYWGGGQEDLKQGDDDIKQAGVRAGQTWARSVCVGVSVLS